MEHPSVSNEAPEGAKAQRKAYYQANRESILAKRKEYRSQNRAKIAERNRAWREANRESIQKRRREYYEENKETILAKCREYTAGHLERIAHNNRRRKFGISSEQFQQMLEAQRYQCAVCETDTPGGKGNFHVDHCHSSGSVRGLLCTRCNTGLGLFKDSTTSLQRAIDYLSAPPSKALP